MILTALIFAASKFEPYKVDLDPQFVIPIFYFVPLLICALLHKYSPKIIYAIVGVIFTACAAYLAYILYLDYAIWKFVMPVIVVFGGLSGLSGWIRFLMKKIRNIGDDDSYFS